MDNPLFQRWCATVERSPRATALVEAATGRKWSRAALTAQAAAWAGAWAGELGGGTARRSRVALAVPNGAEWVQVFLGLLARGAVPAPIDPSEPAEAQLATARSLGASHLWREGHLHRLDAGRPARVEASECLVKVTSASTGAPRGLPATFGQMEADGRQVCRTMGIRAEDSNLAAIPFGYSYGLGNLVIPLLLQGTRSICLSSPLPHAVAADCRRFRPTIFPAVPPLLKALAGSDLPAGALASLRVVISAGSPLDPAIAAAFVARFGCKVHGFYGTSETGGIAYDRSGAATLAGRSVGTPLRGVRLAFRPGGRFAVQSAAVLGGGSFSPGDRASLSPKGELVLRGRSDRMVKVAGRRLDLAEVERALRAVPGVRDAFAHLEPGAEGVLAAAVATALPPLEVRRLLRVQLASWKLPTRLVALAEFPTSARGKTDARKLRQLLAAPRTATSISTFKAERQTSAPR